MLEQKGVKSILVGKALSDAGGGNPLDAITSLLERAVNDPSYLNDKNPGAPNIAAYDRNIAEESLTALRKAVDDGSVKYSPPGAIYRVDLAPQEDEYLLWDKPFDEQSPKVKVALTDAWEQLTTRRKEQGQELREHDRPWSIKKDSKGENIYRSVTATAPGGREAEGSKALLEMGVRGIKYQDQQSRGPAGAVGKLFKDKLPERQRQLEGMLERGEFTPQEEAVVRGMVKQDMFGFARPDTVAGVLLSGKTEINGRPVPAELSRATEKLRQSEDGSHNYVIFDDKDVNIEEVLLQRAERPDLSAESAQAWRDLDKIAKDAATKDDFRRSAVAGNLMDLSNRAGHRFGRAVPVYADEPYLTVPELVEQHDIAAYPQSVGDNTELRRQLLAVAGGKGTVTIYRGGMPEGADIEVGDFVALDRQTAGQYVESEGRDTGFVSKEVPVEDVVWGNADYSEWAYSPKDFREAVGSLEAFYEKRGAKVETPLDVEIEKGPLFQRGPLDGPQRKGMNAEQQEVFSRVIGNRDRSPMVRVRQWWKENTGQRGLALRQGLIDGFAPVEALERQQHEGKLLDAEWSATKAAHLSSHTDKLLSSLLRDGMLKVETDANGDVQWIGRDREWTDGGFEDIFKPIAKAGKMDGWQLWAAANRAQRLIKEGKERLMSQADIDKGLALGVKNPEFQKAMDGWQAFNNGLLDMAEASGVINAEQRAVWAKNDYVPFYRLHEDDASGAKGGESGAGGIEGQRSGIRTLKGGEQQLNDIVENMLMNVASIVDRSAKNLAMRKVWSLMLDAGVVKKTPMGWIPVKVPPEQAAQKLRDIGVDVDTLSTKEREQALTFFQPQPPKGERIVSVMIDGKPVWGEVEDPLMFNAIASMGPNGFGAMTKIFNLAKRTLTTGVTADPGFMLANALRDTVAAYVGTGTEGVYSCHFYAQGLRQGAPQ